MFQLLIVDDERSVLDGLALTIPWHELDVEQVYRAENGLEALELLKLHPIDIVMTDIRMPGMSGLELIQKIRSQWTGIRTVILSGHGEFQYAQEALRAEVEDFLLKPVRAADVMATIRQVQEKLRLEWDSVTSAQQMEAALREHLPMLRSNTLGDLLVGRLGGTERLTDRLQQLDIPFADGDECFLMLIRIEEGFAAYDRGSLSLFEFAIGNMTAEIFGKHFYTWSVTDPGGCLVVALKPKISAVASAPPPAEWPEAGGASAPAGQQAAGPAIEPSVEETPAVERLAEQLQKSVLTYLKGHVSIVVSGPGRFPGAVRELYETGQAWMRQRVGSDSGILFTCGGGAEAEREHRETASLDHLYRTPNLMQLLEAGKWDDAEEKLAQIIGELRSRFADSREHWNEVYHSLYASYMYVAHKNGRLLSRLLIRNPELADADQGKLRSTRQLEEWACGVLRLLRADMEKRIRSVRASVVEQVQRYILEHLSEDVSLQTLADHVHLHPVYLSKIYKLETDETLTEYLHRMRMDQAAAMLKQSNERVYKIAERIGFENTYFTKVFKKHFGLTPQEYRER
ncbi:response regulator [Paenibacillus sp. GCM10027626]|uniref:response regulator n=1 Tax=Paenibacillus sp. GCM10027626 TaxID=3273411 RepID=UPI003625E43C